MPTNLGIDDRLLQEALRIGGQKTKKATVNEALREYVLHRKQTAVIRLFGKVSFNAEYDYKQQRRRS